MNSQETFLIDGVRYAEGPGSSLVRASIQTERIYTRQPRVVRAIQWTGDNFEKIEDFAGSARCAAHDVNRGRLYIFTSDDIKRVLVGDWLYIDERRELHATSDYRFREDFMEGGLWPVPHAPGQETIHIPV